MSIGSQIRGQYPSCGNGTQLFGLISVKEMDKRCPLISLRVRYQCRARYELFKMQRIVQNDDVVIMFNCQRTSSKHTPPRPTGEAVEAIAKTGNELCKTGTSTSASDRYSSFHNSKIPLNPTSLSPKPYPPISLHYIQ